MVPTTQDAKTIIANHFNALLDSSSLGNRAKQLVVNDVNGMLEILSPTPPPEENDKEE